MYMKNMKQIQKHTLFVISLDVYSKVLTILTYLTLFVQISGQVHLLCLGSLYIVHSSKLNDSNVKASSWLTGKILYLSAFKMESLNMLYQENI